MGEDVHLSAEQVALIPDAPNAATFGYQETMSVGAPTLNPDDELVFYCPECAEHEFGSRR
jgi:hypothetical protein